MIIEDESNHYVLSIRFTKLGTRFNTALIVDVPFVTLSLLDSTLLFVLSKLYRMGNVKSLKVKGQKENIFHSFFVKLPLYLSLLRIFEIKSVQVVQISTFCSLNPDNNCKSDLKLLILWRLSILVQILHNISSLPLLTKISTSEKQLLNEIRLTSYCIIA